MGIVVAPGGVRDTTGFLLYIAMKRHLHAAFWRLYLSLRSIYQHLRRLRSLNGSSFQQPIAWSVTCVHDLIQSTTNDRYIIFLGTTTVAAVTGTIIICCGCRLTYPNVCWQHIYIDSPVVNKLSTAYLALLLQLLQDCGRLLRLWHKHIHYNTSL